MLASEQKKIQCLKDCNEVQLLNLTNEELYGPLMPDPFILQQLSYKG